MHSSTLPEHFLPPSHTVVTCIIGMCSDHYSKLVPQDKQNLFHRNTTLGVRSVGSKNIPPHDLISFTDL